MQNLAATESLLTSAEELGRPITPVCQVIPTQELPEHKLRDALLLASDAHRIDGHCLGWLPTAAIVGAHNQGRMITCWRNDDLVGHVIWGANAAVMRIFITWVRRDARMILHGRALTDWVQKKGESLACTRLSLWCAEDLPANLFWACLGFSNTTWRWGRGRNPRRHLLWHRPITSCAQQLLLPSPPRP